MDDLISRLSELRCQYNCFDENERDAYHTLSEAIKALSDVPDTNVVDTIDRQAAIDALSQYPFEKVINCLSILEELPSAKPEIIHCGDCRYKDDGIDEDGIPFLKCLNGRSYGGTRINDFCSWAERRTDEN